MYWSHLCMLATWRTFVLQLHYCCMLSYPWFCARFVSRCEGWGWWNFIIAVHCLISLILCSLHELLWGWCNFIIAVHCLIPDSALASWLTVRGEGGVAGKGRVVGVPSIYINVRHSVAPFDSFFWWLASGNSHSLNCSITWLTPPYFLYLSTRLYRPCEEQPLVAIYTSLGWLLCRCLTIGFRYVYRQKLYHLWDSK